MENGKPRPRANPPFAGQVEIAQTSYFPSPQEVTRGDERTRLLGELLVGQDRQNALLEELVELLGSAQRQRTNELGQWRRANPVLSRNCRRAAAALGQVQTEFLETLTQEISENADTFVGGEFMLNEFVDRFGPRMVHLNGLLQVLSQLSAPPGTSPST